ncbi:hypothetical protein C5167_045145 [Papaver somniferum]|uniref:Uncharacterized protein n=1 Tax=Papaver somniferum TaxID=3469 RepID=A0A4Y7LCI3_PAPSO|nr:hypothetical protein C5167_045145 [Papaver somniferum]
MENIVMLLSINSLIISAEFSEYIQVGGGRNGGGSKNKEFATYGHNRWKHCGYRSVVRCPQNSCYVSDKCTVYL